VPTVKKIESYTAKELFALANAKKEVEDKEFIKCKLYKCYNPRCGKSSRLDKWERVYNFWYEDCPYSPNWLMDGEMRLICPKCRFMNRIIQRTYYNYRLEKTVTDPHPLRDKVEEYLRRGGEFAKEYTSYDKDYYEIWENGLWDSDKRKKLSVAPYINWVNVPEKP
jgi:hypothetical protein